MPVLKTNITNFSKLINSKPTKLSDELESMLATVQHRSTARTLTMTELTDEIKKAYHGSSPPLFQPLLQR